MLDDRGPRVVLLQVRRNGALVVDGIFGRRPRTQWAKRGVDSSAHLRFQREMFTAYPGRTKRAWISRVLAGERTSR